jgi:hypothetical protein
MSRHYTRSVFNVKYFFINANMLGAVRDVPHKKALPLDLPQLKPGFGEHGQILGCPLPGCGEVTLRENGVNGESASD